MENPTLIVSKEVHHMYYNNHGNALIKNVNPTRPRPNFRTLVSNNAESQSNNQRSMMNVSQELS
jgi:hypothetical protein